MDPQFGGGARADSGGTDNGPIFSAAIAAAGAGVPVVFPPSLGGFYGVKTPVVVSADVPPHLVGMGRAATVIEGTGTNDLFHIGSAGDQTDLLVSGMQLVSPVAGGHIFAVTGAGGINQSVIENVYCIQRNPARSIFHCPSTVGPPIDCDLFAHSWLVGTGTGHSVPLINIVSNQGDINNNRFFGNGARAALSGNYVLWVEETKTNSVSSNLRVDQVNYEQCNGGCVMVKGFQDVCLEHQWLSDLAVIGATTKDLFSIQPNADGTNTRLVEIRHLYRDGGSLGSNLVDVRIDTATIYTRLEAMLATGATPITVDLGASAGSGGAAILGLGWPLWHILNAPASVTYQGTSDVLPTVTPQAGAGTGATATVAGDDQAGVITLNTGSGAVANGGQVALTFHTQLPNSPKSVVLSAGDVADAILGPYVLSPGGTGFVAAFAVQPATGTTYLIDYVVRP